MRVSKFEVWSENKQLYVTSDLSDYRVGAPKVIMARSFWCGNLLSDRELAERLVKELHFLTQNVI